MHFHLPKPLHGWREFAGEVGIIVLGVLIALGAEQIVVTVHERYLARLALDHIRTELAYDSAFAVERVAIGDCMRSSFSDLRKRLTAAGDNWPGLQGAPVTGAANAQAGFLFAAPPPINSPHRLWPVSAWTSATTSGVLNGARNRFFHYAALYAMVEWLGRLQDHEIADYSSLVLLDVPQRLDPSARLQILRDLGSVDADNAAIERLAAEFVTAARRNGIPPDPAWVYRELRGEAQTRGKCVKQGADLDAALAREFNAVSH
jgi:hypothetical protein